MQFHLLKRHLLFIALLSFLSGYAQKDKVIINDGKTTTEIVGTIKLMEKNTLTVGTSYSKGDFKIKWTSVNKIFSTRLYLVTLHNGKVLNASINSDTTNKEKNKILLWYFDSEDTVNVDNIVYIKPLEKDFISRFNASLDFGYNLTRRNNLQQLSLRSNVGYLSNYWSLKAAYDAVRSSQENVEDLNRTNANISFHYFLQRNFFLTLTADFLQNDEQLLTLRAATRLGLGNYLVRSNKLYLSSSIGGVWNNENFTGSELTDRNSVELFLGLEANLFNIGNLNLLTTAVAYPSLTEKGRFRTDYKIDLRYNLPLNFYFKVGYTLNFDNQPVEGAVNNDFVLQTTIGWAL